MFDVKETHKTHSARYLKTSNMESTFVSFREQHNVENYMDLSIQINAPPARYVKIKFRQASLCEVVISGIRVFPGVFLLVLQIHCHHFP